MNQLLEVLKALSDESRYKILTLLLTNDLCVGALAKNLGLSEAAISQHLQTLRKAGIVKGEKRGYFTHYIVNRDLLKETGLEIINAASLVQQSEKCTLNILDKNECCKNGGKNEEA